jgi:hypothetical protein
VFAAAAALKVTLISVMKVVADAVGVSEAVAAVVVAEVISVRPVE